jgi:outer membrane protein/adhesin transport system outer membrane protein
MRQARQVESQRAAQYELSRRQVVEQSATSFESLQSTRARITALEAQIKASEIALEGVRQEASVGSRTVLDVLNAEQTLLNAQVSLVQSQRDELTFSFQLMSAIGRLTAQGLALPVNLYDFEANFRAVENKWFGSEILGD